MAQKITMIRVVYFMLVISLVSSLGMLSSCFPIEDDSVSTVSEPSSDNDSGSSNDITAPTIALTNPPNGASGISASTNISIDFSEVMNLSTINTTNIVVMDNGSNPFVVSGVWSLLGNDVTAIFDPTNDLSYSSTIGVTVGTGVTDSAGNALASQYQWSFSTSSAPDITPPTIASASPSYDATSVSVTDNITITFSESMDSSTINSTNITVVDSSNNVVSGSWTYSGTTATFNPSNDLSYETTYTVTVGNGVKDSAGNSLASINWSFTTFSTARYGETLSAGANYTCAVLDNGSAMCWGGNYIGQLGNGSSGTGTDNATPGNVLNLSNVRSISTSLQVSYPHTCAVLDNGSASCWGNNNWGQLGNGLESVKSISAGGSHTCVVLDNGSATCWGNNSNGQLGDGTTNNNSYPVVVTGLESVKSISAGLNHTCAVLDNGSAMCWGWNGSGQLGNDSTNDNATPGAVTGLESVKSISAGLNHTCAVLDNGSATCWGNNAHGKLGNGSTTSGTYSTPNAVSGLGSVKSISAGSHHTCAVLDNGSATCWGYNYNGQLGDGTTSTSNSPVSVSGLGSVNSISAGGNINGSHTCALLDNGSAMCWGYNNDGQLGNGSSGTDSATPGTVINLTNILLP